MNIRRIIIIAVAAFIVGIIAAAVFTKVSVVNISGNEWYTKEEIENLIFPTSESRNSAYILFRNITGQKESIPFVESYTIDFVSPTEVDVIVYEKSIVGYVKYMSTCMYFDKDGIIVDSSQSPLPDIPEITGLKFGSIVLYRKLPVENEKIFGDILNLTQMLKVHNINASRINFSNLSATLYIGDIKVELGTSENMNGKIAELSDMLPKLIGKSGTLYLDNYNPTETNPTYVFIP